MWLPHARALLGRLCTYLSSPSGAAAPSVPDRTPENTKNAWMRLARPALCTSSAPSSRTSTSSHLCGPSGPGNVPEVFTSCAGAVCSGTR